MNKSDENPLESKNPEVRVHPRIPIKFKLTNWSTDQFKGHDVFTHNLSIGGVMIEVIPSLSGEFELKVGETINVGFLLPGQEEFLQVSSEVVWIKYLVQNPEGKESTYIGTKFIVLTEEIEKSVNEYIEKHNEQENPAATT